MPRILNFLRPRVLQLMEQIEREKDQETLAQLFVELNSVLNQSDQELRRGKKRARGTGLVHERRRA